MMLTTFSNLALAYSLRERDNFIAHSAMRGKHGQPTEQNSVSELTRPNNACSPEFKMK